MSDRLLQIIDRYDSILKGAEDGAIERVNNALESAYKRLEEDLLKAYRRQQSAAGLLPNQRKLLILSEVQELLTLLNPKSAVQIQSDYENLLKTATDSGRTMAADLVEAIGNETLQSFAAVPLEALRRQAEGGLVRLRRHTADFRDKASAIVEMGLVQGWGPQRIAPLLRNQLGVTKTRAEVIARTESMSAHNDALKANFERNQVDFVQLQATVDDRVCPTCSARTGNVYEVGKIRVPLHPLCRCLVLPWKQSWQTLGLTNDEFHQEFRQQAIAELRAQGKEPNFGLSPFEKSAGLTEPPRPIWQPGQRVSVTTPRLPTNHVISANSRITVEALDRALDAIQTPGAAERVAKVRQFIDTQGIQAIFWDAAAPAEPQRRAIARNLEYQGFLDTLTEQYNVSRPAVWRLLTEPLPDATGYTPEPARHVFVKVSAKRRTGQGDGFAVRPERINEVAEKVIDADPIKYAIAYWSQSRTSDEEALLTYLHEIGHQVHFAVGKIRPPLGMAIDEATDYGTYNKSHEEWFAEHFSLWVLDAERYAAASPENARWIGEQVERAVQSDRRLQ